MTNPEFICCVEHNEKGEIISFMQLSPEVFKNTVLGKPNVVIGEGRYFTHYVTDKAITPRPTQLTVLEGAILKNLPVPSEIYINNEVYQCDDEQVELEFDQPGTYQIKVVAFPYLDSEFTYEN